MAFRLNLFLVSSLVITLAILFSTLMFLAQMRAEALQMAATDQEQAIRTFWQLLLAKGNDIHVANGRMMAGDYVINGNYELPDKIREIFGGTATIFLGDTRVSTNVLKEDGSRAVGTRLTGPAYDAIFRENRPYRGLAPILGIPYFTAYDPIRDRNGRTIGVLYVGIKKREFFDSYARLRANVIAGATLLEILLIALAWGLLREQMRGSARLREMADQIRLITDSVPAGIAYLDAGLRYRFANRRYGELFGLAAGKIVGRRAQEVVEPRFLATVEENLRLALSGSGTTSENRLVRGDGGVVCVQTTYVPDVGAHGDIVGLVIQHHDITEHMRLDAALRDQLTFLQTLIDTIPSPIFYKDRAGRYLGCNLAFQSYLGRSREDVVGRTAYDIAPRDLADRYFEMDEALFTNPGVQVYDASVVYADGSRHEVTFSKATFPDQDGRVAGLVGVIVDITERKRAEELLAGEKTALEMIVREAPLAEVLDQLCRNVELSDPGTLCSVLLLDGSGKRLRHGAAPNLPEEYSKAIDGTWIGPEVGACGTAAFRNEPVITGDIAPDPLWEPYRSIPLRFGLRSCWSLPVRSADGNTLGTFAVYYPTPRVPGPSDLQTVERAANLASIVIDRNRSGRALRESEERFHQIFDQSDDAIVLFRLDNFAIIDANPAAQELFGYGHAELVSRMPYTLIGQRDFAALIDAIPQNESDTPFQLDRARGIRSDGSRLLIVIRCRVLQLREEYIIHCSIRDITEKERLEEEIKATQAKLIHTNKMTSIGMLASSVAHEINNPNNCISVNAAMLADIWQDAEPVLSRHHDEAGEFELRGIPFAQMREIAPRLLNGVAEGSRRITAIVNGMRDFVREDKSGLQGAVDVNRLVRNAASILWHHIHTHTDHFAMNLQDPLPPARGNGQQIEQVVINLITNALQALPGKEAPVLVTTSCDPGAGTVTIEVRDEGGGMDKSVLARLKEPFFTTKMAEGGTGLGLYISDSILRDHRGSLTFRSAPGLGTTATITLPLAQAAS